jgi:hypothetical protein
MCSVLHARGHAARKHRARFLSTELRLRRLRRMQINPAAWGTSCQLSLSALSSFPQKTTRGCKSGTRFTHESPGDSPEVADSVVGGAREPAPVASLRDRCAGVAGMQSLTHRASS